MTHAISRRLSGLASMLTPTSVLAGYPWALAAVYILPIVSPAVTYALQTALTALFALALRARPRPAAIMLYAVVMLVLTAIAMALDAARLTLDDSFELAKYASVLLAMAVSLAYFRTPGANVNATRLLYVFAVVVLLFALFETFLPDVVRDLVLMYTRPKPVFYGKPIVFFYTTYFAASVYAALAAIFMAKFWTEAAPSWRDAALSAAFIVLIVLTQSRTSFFAGVLLATVLAGFVLLRASRRQAVAIICAALVVVGGAVLMSEAIYGQLSYLVEGIQRYILNFQAHTDDKSSLAKRLSQIRWALDNNRLVLIGAGIGKGYSPLLESWFALVYYRAGAIGIAAYLALWGTPVALAIRFGRTWTALARQGELRCGALLIGVPILCLCLVIASLSSMITDQASLLHFFYFLLSGFYVASFDFLAARRAGRTP